MKSLKIVLVLLIVTVILSQAPRAWAAPPEPGSYLPYGQGIPQDQEISTIPAPLEVAIHGQPVKNTRPLANQVGKPGAVLPKRAISAVTGSATLLPTIAPGSGDYGLWLLDGMGVSVTNDAQVDLVIPEVAIGTTIYAPTHMAPGGACIETVTAHWRYEGMTATAHGHGFWDWCADGTGGWQVFEFMDESWQATYVRRVNGELRYFTMVYFDTETGLWKGLLYNFTLGRWEEKVAISGVNQSGFGKTGWSMWESHYLMDQAKMCPTFPSIQTSDIKLYVNDKWVAPSTSNTEVLGPYGLCWTNGAYSFRIPPKQRDSWLARTPK